MLSRFQNPKEMPRKTSLRDRVFLIRFWKEGTAEKPSWRGNISDLEGNRVKNFQGTSKLGGIFKQLLGKGE